MRFLIFLFSLLVSVQAVPGSLEKAIIIAVIDTGFTVNKTQYEPFLCKYGHRDFTSVQKFSKDYDTVDPVPVDNILHGTHISGLIIKYAKLSRKPFCLVILKFYDPNMKGYEYGKKEIKAIEYATSIKANIINLSGGGVDPNTREDKVVKAFLDHGGTFVAAAGNEDSDTSIRPYYPANSDKRVISVGNLQIKNGEYARGYKSNYGKLVTRWEIGTDVPMFGVIMSGTSQACAIATGKIVGEKEFKKIVDLRK